MVAWPETHHKPHKPILLVPVQGLCNQGDTKPALEGHHRVWHVQVLSYFIAYKYNITHRLSQHLTALSRNSMEQGERDDGDRGPRGNPADDNVKHSVGHGYYCITSYICNKHELSL